jgi:putative nucleotidyltransferase with HDIG domain
MAATLQLGNIRSRSKLIRVGMITAIVGFVLTFLAGTADGRPLDFNNIERLTTNAAINAVWTLLVGFLVTGLLPFIERTFGVLTDLSLLELGDAAHPLLQELVRRAPGTYNHSINVASLAEPAAESIGARGLLVRVGAYFHDIGKMLKPAYFVENQVAGANRHETLLPAMSTLIIIAHIKDGADLARQHHLPQPIIDFIEQHHGTTLVEYFFRRAAEQQREADPESGDLEESAFRYPGPKPQTREAAVLMLADAVESASRALVEPTPSRIESLVEEITMKRLLDGQFDECDLTLQDLRSVQDSLIKSQIAIYHGRVKYPEQRTA